jgi:hypothetical protein
MCVSGVNYEYVPTATVNRRGEKSVWVKCARKTKERVTAMLLAASDGTKCDPFLVFKTRPSTKPEIAHENKVVRHGFGRKLWSEIAPLQDDAQIYGNGAGWWNSELSIEFLYLHFGKREIMHEPILLLWDDFSGHWRADVVIFARLINVELMKVPPGYTYVCQPADVAWNRPLKEAIRKQWVGFLLQQVRAAGAGVPFKMTPPSRRDVVSWITAAWESLSHDTICNGFRKAKLTRSRTNSSMAIARLLSTGMPSSEPNWGSLARRLQDSSIPYVSIHPAFDIEHSQFNNSASNETHDGGFEADDECDA